jgi:hypothetical protein
MMQSPKKTCKDEKYSVVAFLGFAKAKSVEGPAMAE